jgi:hypothetical protein
VEYCQGIKAFPQPVPVKTPGGDCFACAMTAALRHLFPEQPPTFEQAWDYFMQEQNGSRTLWHSWPGIPKAMHNAGQDYPVQVHTEIVMPPAAKPDWGTYAWYQWLPGRDYIIRLEAYLRAGWVVFTEIDMHGRGPVVGQGFNAVNHVVLLDGVREVWEPSASGHKSLNSYIHVICSATGEYWVPQGDFHFKYGGAGWALMRREV